MRYMNQWDVEEARIRHAAHPVLGPATATLVNLVTWTNQNSDGWAYWPKPTRAAAKLMELIDPCDPQIRRWETERPDATPARLKAALTPIKAFRTRQGARLEIDGSELFEIVEAN